MLIFKIFLYLRPYQRRTKQNVIRIEILCRIGKLVKDHKHEGRSTIRKILLKGKIVTSHIYIPTNTKIIIHHIIKLDIYFIIIIPKVHNNQVPSS
jgi:hypothetical protein